MPEYVHGPVAGDPPPTCPAGHPILTELSGCHTGDDVDAVILLRSEPDGTAVDHLIHGDTNLADIANVLDAIAADLRRMHAARTAQRN